MQVFRRPVSATGRATVLLALFLPAAFVAGSANAQSVADSPGTELSYDGLDVGLSLAMPVLGVSFRKVLSDSRTVALTASNSGGQVQLNFTGENPRGGYYLLGLGRDRNATLARVGYGYKWQPNRWSFHLEAALNVPLSLQEKTGLAGLGDLFYLFPIGMGVHYRF